MEKGCTFKKRDQLNKKVPSEPRNKRGKGSSHADVWGRILHAEGTAYAKQSGCRLGMFEG